MSARDQAEHLAERLLEARARHQPADLPADCFGQLDEATAMRIQQLTVERLHAAVAGWKVAVLPDGAVLAAPILDFLLYRNAASVPDRLRGSGGIECEIAFRIGQSLPARTLPYSRAEVDACIDSAFPAIETLRSRLPAGFASPRYALLADMLFNAGLIVGGGISAWRDKDFASIPIELVVNDRTIVRRAGGLPSGDPLGAVVALANHLQRHNQSLLPDQFVTTGSYTGVHMADPGDRVAVRFEGFPELRIAFQ